VCRPAVDPLSLMGRSQATSVDSFTGPEAANVTGGAPDLPHNTPLSPLPVYIGYYGRLTH